MLHPLDEITINPTLNLIKSTPLLTFNRRAIRSLIYKFKPTLNLQLKTIIDNNNMSLYNKILCDTYFEFLSTPYMVELYMKEMTSILSIEN
jgi:hypothetical protein